MTRGDEERVTVKVEMVACPSCEGDGGGDGYNGECRDCLGSGEVTRGRRSTLLRVQAPTLVGSRAAPPPLKMPERSDDSAAVRPKNRRGRPPARSTPPPDGGVTWPRKSVSDVLPWVSYRQVCHWAALGLWVPESPSGSGTQSWVTLAELEGIGLIGRLAGHLAMGSYSGPKTLPEWPDLVVACGQGGVWIAADGGWSPWEPAGPVPEVAVIVDVGAVVADVRRRAETHRAAT